jgi:hypothetical protein
MRQMRCLLEDYQMKTIIEMAREAGLYDCIVFGRIESKDAVIERFAELVRADEREACAKLCEVNHHTIRRNMDSFECAAAIRARGQA